jgi:hypothetical protein
VPDGARVRFATPGTEVTGEGVAVYSQRLETPVGISFSVGVARVPERAWPQSLVPSAGQWWVRRFGLVPGRPAGVPAVEKVAV